MDYGEIKSVSDTQDVEKVREPQRPCYALDGVTQKQASHREHGRAEGQAWSWIRSPMEPTHLPVPGRPMLGAWRKGKHFPRPVSQGFGNPLGAQTDITPLHRGQIGLGGGESTSRVTQPLCDMLHSPRAKHQAELQRDQREQGLTRAQHASVSPLQPTLNKDPVRAHLFPGGASQPLTVE